MVGRIKELATAIKNVSDIPAVKSMAEEILMQLDRADPDEVIMLNTKEQIESGKFFYMVIGKNTYKAKKVEVKWPEGTKTFSIPVRMKVDDDDVMMRGVE